MHDESKPRKRRPAGATRRAHAMPRRARGIAPRFLPIDHPTIQTLLKAIVAGMHRIGGSLDEIVQHMDKGDIPDLPEARAAQAKSRKVIGALLRELDGGSH